MKSNAITRIIIFSIVILILLGILLAGLGIGTFVYLVDSSNDEYISSDSNSGSVSPTQINNIQIEWASGSVQILSADTDTITFTEEGAFDEADRMVWTQSGDTLIIRYSKSKVKIGFLSQPSSKALTLTVPADWQCDDLQLGIASADVDIKGIHADNLDIDIASGRSDIQSCTVEEMSIDAASGKSSFQNCTIDSLEIDSASGSVEYNGWLRELDCDTASGSFEGNFANTPERIDMDSASGRLDITLPEGGGFKVTVDAMSKQFHSEQDAYYDGDCYVYGDMHCNIDFDAVSGSVWIREG